MSVKFIAIALLFNQYAHPPETMVQRVWPMYAGISEQDCKFTADVWTKSEALYSYCFKHDDAGAKLGCLDIADEIAKQHPEMGVKFKEYCAARAGKKWLFKGPAESWDDK